MLSILLCYLKLKNWDAQFIESNAELEAFISINRKELEKNKCKDCKLTKVMRSFHCLYCKRCVARFEFHSHWFNVCIGGQNYFVYLLVLLITNFFYINSILLLTYLVFINNTSNNEISYDFKGRIFTLHFWFVLVIYAQLKIFFFSKIVMKNAARNLTDMENDNWRRIPYMWNIRKEFFNPFDKGLVRNIKEYLFNFQNDKKIFLKILGLDVEEIKKIKIDFSKKNIIKEVILDEKSLENHKYIVKSNNHHIDKFTNVANESEYNSERDNNRNMLENDNCLDAPDSQKGFTIFNQKDNKENIINKFKNECCGKKDRSVTNNKLDFRSILSSNGNYYFLIYIS
jgi:hypothetical protein